MKYPATFTVQAPTGTYAPCGGRAVEGPGGSITLTIGPPCAPGAACQISGDVCLWHEQHTFVCENDRYCAARETFTSVEAFKSYVHDAFPDECVGFTLHETDPGVWRDEHGDVALTHEHTPPETP